MSKTLFSVLWMTIGAVALASVSFAQSEATTALIFDTDMGNDVDDALALGMIHALQSRGECYLLAVTITKDNPLCAPFVDAVNHFYGRGDVPIGVVKDGVTPATGKFLGLAEVEDEGALRYPHRVKSGDEAEEATALLRKVLAAQADHSVVIAQVGFSTNLARLLASEPDAISDLAGPALVSQKVRRLSIMAGAFAPIDGGSHGEYNVVMDLPAARDLFEQWPTDIVFSGYEVGLTVPYPALSIERDYGYVKHHPLQEAYQHYMPTPHERPTWDLTSVLFAVRPDHGYFDLSEAGKVTVDDKGLTSFEPKEGGKHFYLKMSELQATRVREALTLRSSQPPEQR